MHRNAEMVTAARMQRSLERGVLEASLSMPCVHDGVGHQAQARIAVIDDVMRGVEREESWPRFINVLRARGPELREHMLGLVETSARPRKAGARSRQRSLSARLAHAGLGEQPCELLDHAQRVMARARGAWYLLDEQEPDDVLRIPQVREHVLEGENAAWMHTFALALLGRVAAGVSLVAQPSTELSVTLAVEAARDAAAHWTTALELLAEDDAVLLTDPPRGATRSASR